MFHSFDIQLIYNSIYSLEQATKSKERGMLRIKVQGTLLAKQCVEFVNCPFGCKNLTCLQPPLRCNSTQFEGYAKLPLGWFLLRGDWHVLIFQQI